MPKLNVDKEKENKRKPTNTFQPSKLRWNGSTYVIFIQVQNIFRAIQKRKRKKGCEWLFVHVLDSSMEDHPPGLEKTLWILKDRYLHRSDICPISLGMLPDRRFM